MIDFSKPQVIIAGLFALVLGVAAIRVAMNAGKAQVGKAANSGVVVFIALAIFAIGLLPLAALTGIGSGIINGIGLSTGGGN